MKFRSLLPWFIIIVLALLLVCRKTEIKTVRIPAKVGNFTSFSPIPINTEEVLNIETQELKVINTYKETYKDEVQEIVVITKSTGAITEQKINYTIKPQNIEVKIKQPRFSVYGGVEVNTAPLMDIQPTIYMITPKIIYKAGYSTQNKSVSVGIAFKLF